MLIVAILPVTNPLINWPATKLNAPGTSSSIFINSFVTSDIFNSTGTYENPTNANNFSPILKFETFCVTLNSG